MHPSKQAPLWNCIPCSIQIKLQQYPDQHRPSFSQTKLPAPPHCLTSKIAGRNINNLIYADDTTLMAESEEELKSLLMKEKEESEKVDLKLNIQETKIKTSGLITSWQIDGETVADFIFLSSKITADGDCSHEIKRRLLLGR